MKANTIYLFGVVALLLVLSVFKDDFTPDYRNTPSAIFLQNPANGRLATLHTHTWFWSKAILYTISIIANASLCIHFAFKKNNLTKLTFYIHALLAFVLYVGIFINHPKVDVIIVSKINRYLHAPIITLFLMAAFKLAANTKPNSHA